MPALPSASACLKVRFGGIYGTAKWNCIIHTQYVGVVPTAADLATYAQAVGTLWSTQLSALHSNAVTLSTVDVIDLSSPTSAETTQSMVHPGTRGVADLPASLSLVSSWHANIRYRGGHPRNYWPAGISTDMANTINWTSTAITEFQAAFQAFLNGLNAIAVAGGSSHMILLSYFSNHALRPTPLPIPITAGVVHSRVDTQRRRLGKETI
jgi:hypothetical protein